MNDPGVDESSPRVSPRTPVTWPQSPRTRFTLRFVTAALVIVTSGLSLARRRPLDGLDIALLPSACCVLVWMTMNDARKSRAGI